jgi:arsenate reductase
MTIPKVLFVCVENAGRSQIAEAFARIHGDGSIDARSAGSKPSGQINPRAIAVMAERGYDLSTHRSKSLQEVPDGTYEYVVTMGCGDACPWIIAKHREDWDLPDPKTMTPEELADLRDDIERRVKTLLGAVRKEE